MQISENKHKVSSIFSLRKVDSRSENSVEVRTVNFENTNITDENVLNYFNSRIKFLGVSYDFAKQAKLNEDFDFDLKKIGDVKSQMKIWLGTNLEVNEFDVITTKVDESIKSIKGSEYFKKTIFNSLKELIFTSKYPEFNSKYKLPKNPTNQDLLKEKENEKLKKEYAKFIPHTDELISLETGEIKKVFKYELVEKAKILSSLLNSLIDKDLLRDDCNKCKDYIAKFLDPIDNYWTESLDKTKQEIQNVKTDNLLLLYILKLYFAFDGKLRKQEEEFLPVINEILNSIKQNFSDAILSQDNYNDFSEEDRKKINSNLQKIWNFDWTDNTSVEKFWILTNKFCNSEKPDEGDFSKAKGDVTEFSLRHPKTAPNFPSLKEKVISWDKEKSTSNLLQLNQNNFNQLKFLDYLLFRVKKIVEGSDVYKVYQHLFETSDFEWVSWLESFYNNNFKNEDWAKFKLSKDLPKIKQTKVSNYKNNSQEIKASVNIVEFLYSNGEINKKLPKIVINLKRNKNKDKSTETREVLENWLKTHYLDLSKFNIEIGLLRELMQENLLDTQFIQKWINLVISDDGRKNKIVVRTEKRLEELKKAKIELHLQVPKIVQLIKEKLTKIEEHLLLDKNHNEYKVFDKLSFDKYKKLSQVVYETVLLDKKQIAYQKAELAKLTLDVAQVLPIKISRMTSDKSNGKSTLIYDFNLETLSLKQYNKNEITSSILIYPVNMGLIGGSEVKIVDTLAQAIKEFSSSNNKNKYSKVCAGFLNGSRDNTAKTIPVKVTKKDGTDGQYTQFGTWRLFDEDYKTAIDDIYRGQGETVGATKPAGYPKMYFFLIPKTCNNLIIPIQTSKYYLGKYTPYNHLQKYLELEKQIYLLGQKGNKQEVINKVQEVLKLRTYLRSYYRLSSLELDLIRDYKLVINSEETIIQPTLKAKVHFQFGNPRKVYTKELVNIAKPEYVLSVDLGEKHLAVATLSKVNWEDWEKSNFKLSNNKEHYFFKPIAKSFLPMHKVDLETFIDSTNLINSKELDLKKGWSYDLSKAIVLEPEKDNFWKKYTSIIDRYKAQQKQFGVVQKELASIKINLTKKLAEQIASQIVKTAHKHNALVVFENLATGFGRQVETVRLYTAIRRLTAQKLGEVGLLNTSLVKGEAGLDNFATYEFNQGLLSIVNPSYTSKTCSCCGYVPVEQKETVSKKTKEIKTQLGIIANYHKWESESKITFSNQGRVFYTIIAPQKDISNWKILNYKGEDIICELKNKEIYSNKAFRNLLEVLQSWLYTKERDDKRGLSNAGIAKDDFKKEFTKFALKNLIAPRPNQETFNCPFCGHAENADYQASYNIGLHCLIGNKIIEERKLYSKIKPLEIKKSFVEEIRERL